MAFSVNHITTKTANVQWFNDVDPTTVYAINEWLPTNPGFISVIKVVSNSTTLVKKFTFDTEANYNAYILAKNNNADVIARRAYNNLNGITTTRQPE
jgi:hypothetical protein